MAEPDDLVLRLLRDIRTTMDRNQEVNETRFERIEKRLDNIREAMLGESVLGRYAAAEVEERLAAIEQRLATLESRS